MAIVTNWIPRRQLPIILTLCVYIVLYVAGAFVLSSLSSESGSYRQGAFVVLSMCQTGIVVFLVPLIAIGEMNSVIQGSVWAQFLPAEGSLRIVLGLFRRLLPVMAIICLIPGILGMLMKGPFGSVPNAVILRSFFILLAIALFSLSSGFYAAVVCRNAYSAAGLSFLIMVLICTEPVWFGPVISAIPEPSAMIQFSLLINPFVNVAAALNFDILRIDPFYQICPIGQLRFNYPSLWSAVLFNVLVASVIFWRSTARLRRLGAPSAS